MHRNFNDLEFELVGKLCVIVCGFAQVLSGSARGGQGGHLPPKILCCHPSLPPTLSEIKKNGHFPVQSGKNRWLFEGLAPIPPNFDACDATDFITLWHAFIMQLWLKSLRLFSRVRCVYIISYIYYLKDMICVF